MVGNELKAALKAANMSLEELADATGIHASTLSRACSGLVLTGDKPARILAALKSASRKAEVAARKLRESLTAA